MNVSVSPKEVTVVVQGPIVDQTGSPTTAKLTKRGLESIRQHLPGSEVILSTWKDADLTGLDFDQLVESVDPGKCLSIAPNENLNRLIVSSQAGIARANRPYVLKFRTDMELTGVGFLYHFGRYPAHGPEGRVFTERIVTWSWMTKVPARSADGLFHVSDIVHFGRTGDVRALWDIPLYRRSPSELAADLELLANPKHEEVPLARYAAEQYLWLSALRKGRSVMLPKHVSGEAIAESERLLAENFIVLNPGEFGARWKGGVGVTKRAWATVCSHAEWEGLYRKYCDPSFVARLAWETPLKYLFKVTELHAPAIFTLYRNFYHALLPNTVGRPPVSLAKAFRERFKRRH